MNFLAHLYLSGKNYEIMIGNFIADQVKANRFEHFSTDIQKGIQLHRKIDTFTDQHSIFKQSKRRLHERYRHFNGVIIDVFYDYFLAKNWDQYSAIPLAVFAQNVYSLLEDNIHQLPEETQQLLPYMKKQDWLTSYATFFGMESVLNGLNRRTKNKGQLNLAIEDLKTLENDFEADFKLFFNDLQQFVANEITTL